MILAFNTCLFSWAFKQNTPKTKINDMISDLFITGHIPKTMPQLKQHQTAAFNLARLALLNLDAA
jgi:hypothetical protein